MLRSQLHLRAHHFHLIDSMYQPWYEYRACIIIISRDWRLESDYQVFIKEQVILGSNNLSREGRLRELKLESLEQRRLNLARSCSDKMVKDPRFAYLFPRRQNVTTRSKSTFIAPFCRTNRMKNSAIPKFIEFKNTKWGTKWNIKKHNKLSLDTS